MYKNHILIKKKGIKKQYCDNIISIINQSRLVEQKTKNIEGFYSGLFKINPYEQEWVYDLFAGIEEYKKYNVFLAKGPVAAWKTDVSCNYQKYKPGQSFNREHCEHLISTPYRILVWMIYCNTIKKGGETSFPQQKLKIKPEAGKLVIWPAGWTHSHIGIAAPNENKYIVSGWCSFVEKSI